MVDIESFMVDPQTMRREIEIKKDGTRVLRTIFHAEMDDKAYVEFVNAQKQALKDWKETHKDTIINMAEIKRTQHVDDIVCGDLVNNKAFRRKLTKWNSCLAMSNTVQMRNKAKNQIEIITKTLKDLGEFESEEK